MLPPRLRGRTLSLDSAAIHTIALRKTCLNAAYIANALSST
jgi:hypothetical protein